MSTSASSTRLQTDQAELVVLSVLREAPLYGYAITKRVQTRSGGEIRLGPGVLYPLLTKLEKAKLVSTDWEEVKSGGADPDAAGRRRKWYRLTDKGQERLAKRIRDHRARLAVIESFIDGAEQAEERSS